jgi:hypothetical protein
MNEKLKRNRMQKIKKKQYLPPRIAFILSSSVCGFDSAEKEATVAAFDDFGAFISQAAGPKSSSTGLTAVIFGANFLKIMNE